MWGDDNVVAVLRVLQDNQVHGIVCIHNLYTESTFHGSMIVRAWLRKNYSYGHSAAGCLHLMWDNDNVIAVQRLLQDNQVSCFYSPR